MAGNDPRLQGCSLTPFRVHSVSDLVRGVVPDGKLSHFTVGRETVPSSPTLTPFQRGSLSRGDLSLLF